MMRRACTFASFSLFAVGLTAYFSGLAFAQEIQPSAVQQVQTILQEKASRTPAQQKLDSHLHLSAQLARGALSAATMPWIENSSRLLEFDEQQRVEIDIQGKVSAELLGEIDILGGTVESSFPNYGAIRAWIPLLNAEALAEREDVTFVRPADKAIHNGQPSTRPITAGERLSLVQRGENVRRQLRTTLLSLAAKHASMRVSEVNPSTAPIDTNALISEGADLVQNQGFTGTGVKVGVLSDGVYSLATLQALGDLPANVTVLPGQAGPVDSDEGTAMLEIIYDLAPGAQLFFATGEGGSAQMATNIQSLAAAGCNIIVDDLTYLGEGVFQDGIIAQAVNTVTANGALYFSSAQNSGNLDSGTSGTWEGDFVGTGGTIQLEGSIPWHAFDATHNYDAVTARSTIGSLTILKWSDPLGVACNDYDLFVLNSTLSTVLEASTTPQTCTQDPVEYVSAPAAGNVIVIVLYSGSTRALHIDTERGRLAISTSGATFGHNAAGSALSVAATHAQATIFTNGNQAPASYSSDGPRKMFYNPDGSAITPGNFLFSTNGGATLSKVDFTAADCGQSAVPGFNPFCGTSAAAPTAAAIAALAMSANPSLTPSQVISAMKSTALAAKAGFNPPTVGAGIVMANLSVAPPLRLTAASLTFPGQLVGMTSSAQAVTVTNAGTGALTISSIAVTGANNADFAQQSDCPLSPSPLPGGANCTISVTFTPSATGTRTASVSITDDASVSTQTVTLTGIGIQPSIAISSVSASSVTLIPGGSSQTITVTLTRSNYTDSITLATSTLPSEVTATYTQPGAGNSGSITLQAASNAALVSSQAITITASGSGVSSVTSSFNLAVNNPVPTITTLSPSSAVAGAAAQTLTINGTNFVSTSTVTYNAVAHTPTFVSSTQLTIPLTTGDQATAGPYPVVVTNPTPGGGASTPVNFTVNNPVPSITSLSPSSAIVGAAAQTLTINGTNFVSTSTVTYNGTPHTPTYVSATQLTISLTTGDQATAGAYPVVVTNPALGGGASTPVNFSVNNPEPTIDSLSPSSATAGAAAQTLTINGTNFVSTSTVTYNGTPHTPSYVSATQLTIPLTTGDQAAAGTYPVVVTNPTLGGGASSPVNFTVNNPAPTVSSLSPSSANAAAAAQTLTINGTNFVSTSTVTYNGVAHTPTFVSATQLTIPLTTGDQATAGSYPVVVTNPAPGGGASSPVNFTVQDFSVAPASGSSTSATVTAGGTATYNLSIAAVNGLSGTVSFTCTGAPSKSTCTVSPSTLTLGSSATSITVTVTTTAPSVSAPRSRPLPPVRLPLPGPGGLVMLALALAGVAWAVRGWRQPEVRRRRAAFLTLTAGLLLTLAMPACGGGGGGGNPGTPTGTYNLTVTGSTGAGSATVSHSVTLTLTVR